VEISPKMMQGFVDALMARAVDVLQDGATRARRGGDEHAALEEDEAIDHRPRCRFGTTSDRILQQG